ncbi:MAG: extracellular solute-binding protein [Armatimonadota bacterium]|nr:extracellular solute-binding protein [bacterium]
MFRRIVSALLLVISLFAIGGCKSNQPEKIKLVVWGPMVPERMKGWEAAYAEFERRHPNIEVEMLGMGAGNMNSQKLMTAIVGKVPPDVVLQDRFTVGDWAARATFTPLNELIERDRKKHDGVRPEEYYKAAWNEAVYEGKVYAIPDDIDDRVLYYNRQLFREVGLDPNRPPRTWDELISYSKRLTKYRADGGFDRIGFIPLYGNSWLYLFSWQNGGEFMSPDCRTCTLDNPKTVEALDFLVKYYDQFKGVQALNSFASGFKGGELDPFLTGQVAMKVDCGIFINSIARYNPGLDFAVAPAPVPVDRYEGKAGFKGKPQYITWSGGFSWAIPRGARHVEESWALIKWLKSEEGTRLIHKAQREYNISKGRTYVPWLTANSRVNDILIREFSPKIRRLRDAQQTTLSLLPDSLYRPVTFIGLRLWDEQVRATDSAINHKKSPKAALSFGQRVVQKELDKVRNKATYHDLNWAYPIGIVGLFAIIGCLVVAAIHRRRGPLSRLSKKEAVAGYLFACPWLFGFLVFTLGPIIASLVFSFCDYDVLHPAKWVGLNNYVNLLTDDRCFMSKAMYNVGYLALWGLPLGMIVSLSAAMLLNTKVRGMNWYRTVYYLPSIVPSVASAVLWIWVLNPEYGLINTAWRATFTSWFHIAPPLWLASEYTSKPALIVMGLWAAGGGIILWLAGLQGISRALYEAADIDGAGWWSRLWNVTLPMLTPYIFFNLVMGTIGVLQSFETQYIMTGGGPVDSTMVPVLYLFSNAFNYFKMGYASAIAWILFVVILLLTLFNLKMAKKWVYYENEKGG